MIQSADLVILKFINAHIEEQDGDPNKVEVLNLKNCKVPSVSYLNKLPNLKIIDLRNNNLSTTQIPLLPFLQQLHLCQNNLTKIPPLQHLPCLLSLDLRGNQLLSINESLCCLPVSLTQLKARCNLLVSVVHIVKMVNRLQVLWLDENLFIRGSHALYQGVFAKLGLILSDFWI